MRPVTTVWHDKEVARAIAQKLAADFRSRMGRKVRVEESIHHRFEGRIEVPFDPPEEKEP